MEQQRNKLNQPSILHDIKIIDPLHDGISSVELVRYSGSDLDIVNAARVSYGRESSEFNERDEKLLNFLIEHGHTSPFEHNQLSFRVKAPIFVQRQWFRHRMNSYNEISYRYVQAKTEFYIPNTFRLQNTENKQSSHGSFDDESLKTVYKKALKSAYETYETMLNQGVCREQARAILPVATYTEFFFTCNLHSLMHFLKLRLSSGAQKEIQEYAKALLELSIPHFPVSLKLWSNMNLKDKEWTDQILAWTEHLGVK